MTPKAFQRIAIIGFGEVGGIFGRDLAERGIEVSVYDILLHSPAAREAMPSKARECQVRAQESLRDCLGDAELAISAVTASSAAGVAEEALAATYPEMGWQDDLPDYLIGRVAEHGRRRVAEMRRLRKRSAKSASILAWPAPPRNATNGWWMKSRGGGWTIERKKFSWCALADALVGATKSTQAD
jgi:NADP oxidoreductase coenzyme F420-dependent